MEKIVSRESILRGTKPKEDAARDVLRIETHHDHPIVRHRGKLYWQEVPDVRAAVDKIGLGDIVMLFESLGYDRNSETFRKMYRGMGYSLFDYWELFHWETNNDIANEYVPNQKH